MTHHPSLAGLPQTTARNVLMQRLKEANDDVTFR